MEEESFVDFYELLGLSPNALSDTIERVFRHLARRFHPDNQVTADRDRFDLLLKAYKTLRDPAKRAEYDVHYRKNTGIRTEMIEVASDGSVVEQDVDIQNKLLSLFYAKRRINVMDPGVPEYELERVTGYPVEFLAFNLWYMRERRWILKTENGMYAITADGVDHATSQNQTKATKKLLTDQS